CLHEEEYPCDKINIHWLSHRLVTVGGPAVEDAYINPDVSQITSSLIVGVENAIDSDSTELEYSVALESPSPNLDTEPFVITIATPLQTLTSPLRPIHTPTPSPCPLQTPTPPPHPIQTPTPPLIKLQRKWKSLRDSFNRENAKNKNVASGSAATSSKQQSVDAENSAPNPIFSHSVDPQVSLSPQFLIPYPQDL
ncbi:unnamed protein product, partial [Leptidea sinapis]